MLVGNKTAIAYLNDFAALTTIDRFTFIEQDYSVRGYSFLPSEQYFAVIKSLVRKLDIIYSPTQCDWKRQPHFQVMRCQNEGNL